MTTIKCLLILTNEVTNESIKFDPKLMERAIELLRKLNFLET